MADVNVSFDLPDDPEVISKVLDAICGAVDDITGQQPMFGLQVDGEHRDADDPATGLFE
jgi:hypothetical protein